MESKDKKPIIITPSPKPPIPGNEEKRGGGKSS